jgi:hypothetical protein
VNELEVDIEQAHKISICNLLPENLDENKVLQWFPTKCQRNVLFKKTPDME